MSSYIKYRPTTLDDCVIPSGLRRRLNRMVSMGRVENILFYGKPGTGKSVVASLLSSNTEVIRCDGMLTPAQTLAFAYRVASSVNLFEETRKVVVLDEIDRLTEASQEKCRALIDDLSHITSFAATTNDISSVIPALRSRLTEVCFDSTSGNLTMVSNWKTRLTTIYKVEYGRDPDDHLMNAALRHFPDGRRMITGLLSGLN